MPFIYIRHQVEDFDRWKPIYDEHAEVRRKSGCRSEQLFRASEDPNHLFVVLEWDSLENARRFIQSDDLRQAMRRAGVIEPPEFRYLELIERKGAAEETGRKIA